MWWRNGRESKAGDVVPNGERCNYRINSSHAMVISWPKLPPRAMFGSLVLLKLEYVSMSVTRVTTKSQMDVYELGCHQEHGDKESLAVKETYWAECPVLPPEAMGTSELSMLQEVQSGSMILWQPGSVLMPQAHCTIKGHADVPGLYYPLKHCAELANSSPLAHTQESWPHLSSGQQRRGNFVSDGGRRAGSSCEHRKAGPTPSLLQRSISKGNMPFHHHSIPLLTTCGVNELAWDPESRKFVSAPF